MEEQNPDQTQVIPVHSVPAEETSPQNPGGSNPEPVQVRPSDSEPDAAPVSDPHPVDEDPEDHVGRRRKDPWADEKQTDWPNNDAELAEDGSDEEENA